MRQVSLVVKRVLDAAMSLVLAALLCPALALIATLVWLDSGRPVLFTQDRVGLNGRSFRIYKFRTMVPNADRVGLRVFTKEDDPRITRVGRWLRKWSLDELPQLFNIVRGDMSFVGPRPTLAYQVTKYDARQGKRLLMRPGVTGWAQVNGRNSLTWPERIELDVWYVEHWSLWLDFRTLLRTVQVVWRREGVYGQMADEISRVGAGLPGDTVCDVHRFPDA